MLPTTAPRATTGGGSPFAISSRMRLAFAVVTLPAILTAVAWGRDPRIDFASLILTPAGIQATLERCDGSPQFETAFANWLETAVADSPVERAAIRTSSLRLLEDTTDRQLAL